MAFSPTIDGPVDTAYMTALERRGDSTHVLKMSLRKFIEDRWEHCDVGLNIWSWRSQI